MCVCVYPYNVFYFAIGLLPQEGQVDELEAMLKATKLELRSANDRIKSLQRSLAGEGDDELEDYNSDDEKDDIDGMNSDTGDSDGSYQIGQYDTSDDDVDDQSPNGISEYLKEKRRNRSKVIEELMKDDSVDGIQVGKSRKRVDELLDESD